MANLYNKIFGTIKRVKVLILVNDKEGMTSNQTNYYDPVVWDKIKYKYLAAMPDCIIINEYY